MSGHIRLPAALLDLVFHRTFGSSVSRRIPSNVPYGSLRRRYSQATALKARVIAPEHTAEDFHSLYLLKETHDSFDYTGENIFLNEDRNNDEENLPELDKRINALKNTGLALESLEDMSYSEEELLSLYEDVLANSTEASPSEENETVYTEEHDILHLEALVRRLQTVLESTDLPISTSSLASRLQRLRHSETEANSDSVLPKLPSDHPADPHRALVSRLQHIINNVQQNQPSTSAGHSVAIGILTPAEWGSLARYCARASDSQSLQAVLDMMKQSSYQISEEMLNSVVDILADAGDVGTVDALLTKYLPGSHLISERLRDLHIKAYLRNEPPDCIPSKTLEVLHNYENRAIPAPQCAYTRLITHLFHQRNAVAHAHAWDLFAHMRYAAHPYPDALTYSLMIRACATPSFAHGVETERALDLFTEMTVDHGIPPTAGTYAAVILACARSGDRKYVHEAFRIAKEMLDAHRDARGEPAYAPDRRLFLALLEGAKRVRDLSRARWILAEMVKASMEDPESHLFVDEEVMVHVLNAYAAYRPTFKRSETLIKEEKTATEREPERQQSMEQPGPVTETPEQESLAHLPPQSRGEVVFEVETLMSRVIADSKASSEESRSLRFRHVILTPRLLNAYLSVLYVHAPFETWSERYRTIFSELGVPRSASTFIFVLERCAQSRKGPERKMTRHLAEEVWKEWEAIETSWRSRDPGSASLTPRQVERANASMIRILSNTGNVDRALDLVRSFVQRYPPTAVREPAQKSELRSSRVTLAGNRPLVKLTSEVDIPDDSVPPFLTFPEVDVLHHRLVAANKVNGIKYLKWVCKSYEGSLRRRRERALHAAPMTNDAEVQRRSGTEVQ